MALYAGIENCNIIPDYVKKKLSQLLNKQEKVESSYSCQPAGYIFITNQRIIILGVNDLQEFLNLWLKLLGKKVDVEVSIKQILNRTSITSVSTSTSGIPTYVRLTISVPGDQTTFNSVKRKIADEIQITLNS